MNLLKGFVVGLGLTVLVSTLLVLPYAWPELREGWRESRAARRRAALRMVR